MLNPLFLFVSGVFLLLYGGINYYIGLRGWQAVFSYVPFLNPKVYWLVVFVLSFAYIFSRFMEKFLPASLHEGLTLLGAYWLAFMLYSLLVIAAIDILRLLERWLRLIPVEIKQNLNPALGIGVLIFLICIVSYGAWNAKHPKVTPYDLTIAKQAGDLEQLHIVLVSDIHLGTIIHNGHLTEMVTEVNQLNPDLLLFAGDVFDEDIESRDKQQIAESFRRLYAPYGVFAIMGNHEYIGGNADEAEKYLSEAGVKVLRDSVEEIAGSFYLVGRDDRSGARFNNAARQPLASLMQGLDSSRPIILMDHQPAQLDEPEEQGVDLQLSGHTHRGQMFPIQWITGRIFEKDWGYLRKNNFQLIVSSGYGTWGPPVRVGNSGEIVDITLHFAP